MKKLIAALMFVPAVALADGPFLDLGVGYAINMNEELGESYIRDYSHDDHKWGCSDNPLAYIGLGYQYKALSVQLEHWSSFTELDAGIHILSVKYRFGLK